MKIIHDVRGRFNTGFDSETGYYYRTDELDTAGRPTGKEPFMASFPHLLDVGIMGHCLHGISGRCIQTGVQCYQDGLHKSQPNMSLNDFTRIVKECEGKVFQFALGGRGDPEMHEDFEAILDCCRSHGIVPNMTTSGFGLTGDTARLMKRYLGAAAVSWYRTPYTTQAINMLLEAGVTTNIHYVLSDSSIDEAITMLESRGVPAGINRVIFLLHKPVGLGTKHNILRITDPRVRHFFKLFDNPEICALAGFDSCCIPAVMNMTTKIHADTLDTCEGARYSAYISPGLKMLPCSFDQEYKWAVDITQNSIQAAWDSPLFENFRQNLRESCPDCAMQTWCMGGCPINKEIVLCGMVNGGFDYENKN